MPGPVALPRHLRDAIVAWALECRPNEACGIVSADRVADEAGQPSTFHRLTNAAASPYRFIVHPTEQLRLMLELDDAGQVVWGIVHSHVRSPAEPSPTDVDLAFHPDALHLICSLADPDDPPVRAWRIRDGVATEVPLEVGEYRGPEADVRRSRDGVAARPEARGGESEAG